MYSPYNMDSSSFARTIRRVVSNADVENPSIPLCFRRGNLASGCLPFVFVAPLHPPPSSRAFFLEFAEPVREGHSLLLAYALANCVEDLHVLLFEVFKPVIQFFVPRVKDKDLKAERRSGDHEVGQRNSACELHVGMDDERRGIEGSFVGVVFTNG